MPLSPHGLAEALGGLPWPSLLASVLKFSAHLQPGVLAETVRGELTTISSQQSVFS